MTSRYDVIPVRVRGTAANIEVVLSLITGVRLTREAKFQAC